MGELWISVEHLSFSFKFLILVSLHFHGMSSILEPMLLEFTPEIVPEMLDVCNQTNSQVIK